MAGSDFSHIDPRDILKLLVKVGSDIDGLKKGLSEGKTEITNFNEEAQDQIQEFASSLAPAQNRFESFVSSLKTGFQTLLESTAKVSAGLTLVAGVIQGPFFAGLAHMKEKNADVQATFRGIANETTRLSDNMFRLLWPAYRQGLEISQALLRILNELLDRIKAMPAWLGQIVFNITLLSPAVLLAAGGLRLLMYLFAPIGAALATIVSGLIAFVSALRILLVPQLLLTAGAFAIFILAWDRIPLFKENFLALVKKLANWFFELSERFKQLDEKTHGMASSIAAGIGVFVALNSVLQPMTASFEMLIVAVAAFNVILKTAIVPLQLLASGALFAFLLTKVQGFKEGLVSSISFIVNVVSDAVKGINWLTDRIERLPPSVQKLITALTSFGVALLAKSLILGLIIKLFDPFILLLTSAASSVVWLATKLVALITVIRTLSLASLTPFLGILGSLAVIIALILTNFDDFKKGIEAVGRAWDFAAEKINKAIEALRIWRTENEKDKIQQTPDWNPINPFFYQNPSQNRGPVGMASPGGALSGAYGLLPLLLGAIGSENDIVPPEFYEKMNSLKITPIEENRGEEVARKVNEVLDKIAGYAKQFMGSTENLLGTVGDSVEGDSKDFHDLLESVTASLPDWMKDVLKSVKEGIVGARALFTGSSGDTAAYGGNAFLNAFFGQGFRQRETDEQIKEFGGNIAHSAQSHLSDGIFDGIRNGFRRGKEIVVSFGDSILRAFTDQLSRGIVEDLYTWGQPNSTKNTTGFVGGLLGGIASLFGGGGGEHYLDFSGYEHAGGLPKLLRFAHSGLGLDEGMFIGQEGEGVLSKKGMNALAKTNLAKLNAGGNDRSQAVTYNIFAADARSFASMLNENKAQIHAMVGDAVARNQDIRRVMQGSL